MLAVASILCPRLNSKGDQSSACSGHFFAKNLLGFACRGQYFMSEIKLERGSKFCLQWPVFYVQDRIKKGIQVRFAVVIHLLKFCLVLLAVSSILCLT